MSAGQRQKSTDESPHHERNRDGERAVDGTEVQQRKHRDIDTLGDLPQQTRGDSGGQDGQDGQPAVGQHPVDQQEDEHADHDGGDLQQPVRQEIENQLSVLPRKRKLSRLCCAAVSAMEVRVRVPMANASPSETSWFMT